MRIGYDLIVRQYPDFPESARATAGTLLELAVAEDLGTPRPDLIVDADAVATHGVSLKMSHRGGFAGDLTADATIPEGAHSSSVVVARADGVVAGMPVLHMAAIRFGLPSFFEPLVRDGERVARGTALARLAGPTRQLLMMERTALNFLQRLSGIATMTARFVAAVAGTGARILDTRKTTPGWRALEKYAVRCGGGANHRFGLFDAVLIKDNHLAWLASGTDPIGRAVAAARAAVPAGTVVEIEVDSLAQLDRALACSPDAILLDNFALADMAEAVRRRDARAPGILLEASGGVNLETVAGIARTGVDRISVGALTHSAPAFDIALDFESDGGP